VSALPGDRSWCWDLKTEIVPDLEPAASDYVLEKYTCSACYDTGLDRLLRSPCVDQLHSVDRHAATDTVSRYGIVTLKDTD